MHHERDCLLATCCYAGRKDTLDYLEAEKNGELSDLDSDDEPEVDTLDLADEEDYADEESEEYVKVYCSGPVLKRQNEFYTRADLLSFRLPDGRILAPVSQSLVNKIKAANPDASDDSEYDDEDEDEDGDDYMDDEDIVVETAIDKADMYVLVRDTFQGMRE